jgi:hypothetical protein
MTPPLETAKTNAMRDGAGFTRARAANPAAAANR